MKHLLSSLLLLLVSMQLLKAQEEPWQFPDPEGTMHSPLVVGDKKGIMLFFVSPYCPTANTFMPEINRIAEEYAGQFTSYLVHADPGIKTTDAYQHAVMFKAKATVLLDKEQRLAKRVQAKTTPEVVVLAADGKPLYQGRVNDLYAGPTKRKKQATTKDLRDALDAIQAGKPVAMPHTEAVGCKITGMN